MKIPCEDIYLENGSVTLTAHRMTHPTGEWVDRRELAQAITNPRTQAVTHNHCGDEGIKWHRYWKKQGRTACFGCCTFAPKEAAIIRKWALARTRKTSKKTKRVKK